MKKIKIILIIIIITLFDINNIIGAEKKIKLLPNDLLDIAQKNHCDQIDDFYDRYGVLDPPYVYGYLAGEKEKSAVFWCERKENNKSQYNLIIHSSSQNKGLQNCPNKIIWLNYPGGLSIYKDINTSLDDFVYIENPQKRPPKKIKMTHNAILSEYDGKEELFYCHEGAWLMRQRD